MKNLHSFGCVRARTASGLVSLLASAFFFLGVANVPGALFPPRPSTDHYYVDQANLLQPEDAQAVDRIASQLLQEEKIPLLVVTIPSLYTYRAGDSTVEEYAQALFDHWGIGSKDRNYGVLLLVSLGDRRARIELGAGWAHAHDEEARHIMDDIIVPAFKTGDYSAGIRQGVEALDKVARGLGLTRPKPPWWAPWVAIGGIVFIIGVIVSLFRSGRRGWAWGLIAALGLLLVFMLRSAAKSRGSGGSFRGGFSGGGGATGKW